ncbi:MAG: Crp/Fnr family transcriptional regulator [Paramuribaculum sp.]|nr:Crp/Fnr family transcriptional regulator [Paramuribaculum sp.]MDE7151570.1 Crp/Fnr family transcriptional regulator [Candidatus Amulumruptor sp.]
MPTVVSRMRKACRVSDATLLELAACLEPCSFPKRHLLVVDNARSRYAYFVEKGLTRSFWIVDGEEITTSFSTDGAIVFSMDELYYDRPSEENVETIEAVTAFRIHVGDLTRLLETNIELANWGRIIHQDEYRRLHRSHKERLTLPARERYEAFCNQFPEVAAKARLGHIASYLGLRLSTLSRLRGRI